MAPDLLEHGTDDQKRLYLPKLVSGEWTGTMCLTEAHCGTDLGLLRSKAEPQADGTYLITGSKIFISAGEHDMSENIVHLVLARPVGVPGQGGPGTKGLSLFVVPKHHVDLATGKLTGERNGVVVTAVGRPGRGEVVGHGAPSGRWRCRRRRGGRRR